MNKLEFSKLNKKEDMILAFNQLKDDYRTLFAINDDLQSKIDKANEIIKDWHQEYNGLMETNNIYIPKDKPSLFDLEDILKEDK